MSFDKDYPNRKDWRKPYTDSRAFDGHCRNHGSCPYCQNGRQHSNKRRMPLADIEAKEARVYLGATE